MEHDGNTDACADVGGTCREITKSRVEREIQFGLDLVVNRVDLFPRIVQLKPGPQDLDAKVILLVDHDRNGLAIADRNASWTVRGGVLLRDQVAFDQQLPIDFG
jgi:hypothetical protein